MGVHWWRVTEYDIECDCCHTAETVYSGDCYDGRVVINIPSAIKVAGFHRSKGKILCDKCFENRRKTDGT